MTQLSDLAYIDETGYHYADYPTFLTWLQNEYKAIYGEDVYLEADSQDGQMIAIYAKALFDSAALGSSVYNSFSPSTAQGNGFSSVVKINGIKRRVATKSTADVTVAGTVGTTILNGIAEDTIGQKWMLPASVIIPISGTIVVTAEAENEGMISALPATITKIFTPTLGWQTVNNVNAATEGVPVETDAELRIRQTFSTALPSLSVFDGTLGAVSSVEGVSRVKGYENDTAATDSNGIPEHSIAVVVEGGDAVEIAQQIANHKTPGTGTFGSTTEEVYDMYGNPVEIKFSRPTIVPIKVKVTLEAFTGYTTGYDVLIQQAVADLINALNIGDDVLITKLYVPANLPGTVAGGTYDIQLIEIAKVPDAFGTVNVPIVYNEAAEIDLSDITVVVV